MYAILVYFTVAHTNVSFGEYHGKILVFSTFKMSAIARLIRMFYNAFMTARSEVSPLRGSVNQTYMYYAYARCF